MAPKFKVGAHVITYTLFLGVSTCAAFAISEIYSVSEEEKLRVLREKYPAQIKKQEMQHKDIQEFFNNMKNGQSPELETKFNDMLKAGKNASRRSEANPASSQANSAIADSAPSSQLAPKVAIDPHSTIGSTTADANAAAEANSNAITSTNSNANSATKTTWSWWGW